MSLKSKISSTNPLVLKKDVAEILRENFDLKSKLNHEQVTREKRDIELYKNKYEFGRFYSYQIWLSNHYPSSEELIRQANEIEGFKYKPLISVLIPVYKTPKDALRKCLESIEQQSYPNWEICLTDDNSKDNGVNEIIGEFEKKLGERFKSVVRKTNGNISVATNDAMSVAKGEFCALVDHDDLVWPNAFYEVVKALDINNSLDFIYSDEDKLEDNIHNHPFFKPDYSKYFLLSTNYITHLAVIRTSLLKKIGGLRSEYNGAQDWDLFLRLSLNTDKIYHIPTILYSWRVIEGSTSGGVSSVKPYTVNAQKSALEDHLKQSNVKYDSVEENKSKGWRINFALKKDKVSIIIPTKDCLKYLKKCLSSILEKSTYKNYEIVIVDTGSTDNEVGVYYKSLKKYKNVKVVYLKSEKFNFSDSCNLGAKSSSGDYYLFLNNDTKVISGDWLEAMLGYANQDDVGAVGAKLLYEDGTIQHAGGLLTAKNIANHSLIHTRPDTNQRDQVYLNNARECSVVTAACLMISKKKFEEVGGFNTKLRVTFNDVDFCLKLRKKGYLNIYTPYAELYHYESKSIGVINTDKRDALEVSNAADYMRKTWSDYLKKDPYMNPNFNTDVATINELRV